MAARRENKVFAQTILCLTFLLLCLIGSACVNSQEFNEDAGNQKGNAVNNNPDNPNKPARGEMYPAQNVRKNQGLNQGPNQERNANLNAGPNQAGNAGGQGVGGKQPSIVEDPACRREVSTYCSNMKGSNLQVLECLQNEKLADDAISTECQHVIFTYKQKLTVDFRFEAAGQEVCRKQLDALEDCRELERGKGLVVPCLIEHSDSFLDATCKKFLAKLEPIVFGDYRLIYRFVQDCDINIRELHCGRLETDERVFTHGETVACLTDQTDKLTSDCRKQIIRVAELQADDWTKDRALFHACRDDRERMCGAVAAGNGQVYRCLFKHKFDSGMSDKCRERLVARQKLQREDFKVNGRLASQCAADILNNHCVRGSQVGPNSRETRLSIVLLCLENAKNNGSRLSPECRTEMMVVRRGLMEDFQLTPEIVTLCAEEIRSCNPRGGARPDKQTLHCLMDKVRGKSKNRLPTDQHGECRRALQALLKEVNVRENVDTDPVLQEACSSVINLKCSNVDAGDGKVIDCLMDFIDKPILKRDNPDCREKLMEIQYFVSRDFTLSVSFYRRCAEDMQRVCKADLAGHLGTSNQSAILICLYRAGKAHTIAPECAKETKRVLMERARSVDLDPEVEEACRADLTDHCSDKTEKNDEMDCLEDKLDKLDPECKKVVERFIEEDEEEPELNDVFREECGPVIKAHCQAAAESEKDENSDTLMQCLIRNKNDEDMSNKCRAAVLHHQLVTMKDWKLSPDFKMACKDTVKEHCPSMHSKANVVMCLSTLVRNDTMMEAKPRVAKPCRKQLRFELLQMGEDIKLDPDLERSCEMDVQHHCKGVSHGRSQVQQAKDPNTDYVLMTKCKSMIKKYCIKSLEAMRSPAGMFRCLVVQKEEQDFDSDCAKVIIERERMRAQDVRLNPELMTACEGDIHRHCRAFMPAKPDEQMSGKVLYCLRRRFAIHVNLRGARTSMSDQRLSQNCYEHVQDLIKESVLDYMQDRQLAVACQAQIVSRCLPVTLVDNNNFGDRVEVIECLRRYFEESAKNGTLTMNKPCMNEVVRVMGESKSDVHLDTQLYAACANDIQTSCKDIPRGEGRQMSCLLELHEEHSVKLRPECNKILTDRKQLWALAAKVLPPDTLGEAASMMLESTARNYFMAVIFAFIGVIFIGGLFCGRVTKRVAAQMKNR